MIIKYKLIFIAFSLMYFGLLAVAPRSASADVCCETSSGWVEAGIQVLLELPNNPEECDKIYVWSDDCDMEWRQYECLEDCALCYRLHPGADCAPSGTWMSVARVETGCDIDFRGEGFGICPWANYVRKLMGVKHTAIQAKCNC